MKPQTLADIHPLALYDADDVARVLDLHVDTVYEMGATGTLPASRCGPRRGKTKFLGSVIIAYVQPVAA